MFRNLYFTMRCHDNDSLIMPFFHSVSVISLQAQCFFIYYPPEVRRGEYWVVGVFLMPYFPLVKILHYNCINMNIGSKMRNTSEAVLRPPCTPWLSYCPCRPWSVFSYITGIILSGDLIYKGVNDRIAIKRLIRNTLLNGHVCLSTSTTIISEIASNIVSISLIPGRDSL